MLQYESIESYWDTKAMHITYFEYSKVGRNIPGKGQYGPQLSHPAQVEVAYVKGNGKSL